MHSRNPEESESKSGRRDGSKDPGLRIRSLSSSNPRVYDRRGLSHQESKMRDLLRCRMRLSPVNIGAARIRKTTHAPPRVLAVRVTTCVIVFSLCLEVRAQSGVQSWGDAVVYSGWNDEAFAEISAGENHTVARRSDGAVVG